MAAWDLLLLIHLIFVGTTTAPPPARSGDYEIFEINIQEDGAKFTERIVLNQKKNMEIIVVPTHNKVNGATYIHDFNTNLTLRRDHEANVCFLTNLSRDIEAGIQPRPREMAAALKSVRSYDKSSKIRTTVIKRVLGRRVTDDERLVFNDEMQELCKDHTIYMLNKDNNTVMARKADLNRFPLEMKRSARPKRSDRCEDLDYRCILKLENCRYSLVKCRDEFGNRTTTCQEYDHVADKLHCCIDCCMDEGVRDGYYLPCSDITKDFVEGSDAINNGCDFDLP